MKLIKFRISGRFGHFLRAEASASALSYPVPPRTVILGILGAILGLQKDTPQIHLEPANIAISGEVPKTHWHRAKFRKDPPAPLPLVVKRTQTADRNTAPEKATLILQEWLFEPSYIIWVSIPEPFHAELTLRLKNRKFHFTPFLGLSELIADIEFFGSRECSELPKGTYSIQSVIPQDAGIMEMNQIYDEQLVIHSLQMPRTVTPDRIFSHCSYFLERDAKPVPIETEYAYEVAETIVVFL